MATKTGTSGNDILYGGGPDTLVGLGGNDTYAVYSLADVVEETATFDRDTVLTFSSYALATDARVEVLSTAVNADTQPFYLVGNGFDQTIVGNYGDNILDGAQGSDTLIGLFGNDVYRVYGRGETIVEAAEQGSDTVYVSGSFFLNRGVAVEYLGAADQASATAGVGIVGNEYSQIIVGSNAADRLSGGGGNDTLAGLGGDDVYFIGTSGSALIVEAAGQGYDTVSSQSNFQLAADASVEVIRVADDAPSARAFSFVGNGFNQVITGGGNNDTLNGLGGADTLAGGRGDDVYRLYSQSDFIIEQAGEGQDIAFTSASYRLGAVSIETLSAADQGGTDAINLAGNGFAQTLIGNYGANLLDGGGGGDTLIGLNGNDTYRVYGVNDVVREGAGGGTDIVYADASFALAADSEVEALSTLDNVGTRAINLTGSNFAQTIVGNLGANVLDGGAGADTLVGLAGADAFRFLTALGDGNIDVLADFGNGNDVILLNSSVFAGLATGPLAPGAIAYGAAASDADDRLVYNPVTGALSFDADGNGGGAATQFAQLPTGLAATAIQAQVEGSLNATVSAPQVQEGDAGTTNLVFTITFDRAASTAFDLAFATIDGTAIAGQDYTAVTGTVSVAAGQTSATVTVPVLTDTAYEPTESLQLRITGDQLAAAAVATGTIVNDDTTARINTGGTYSVGGATLGTVLEAAFPGATAFIFGAPFPQLSFPHTIAFGPASGSPGQPSITFGDREAIGGLDFSQLGTGLVIRAGGDFQTVAGATIISAANATNGFTGRPTIITGSAFDDLIDRSDALGTGTSNFYGTIAGGAGNDRLIGAAVQDGGEGNDRLEGIRSTQMTGGAGADVFVLPTLTRTPNTNSWTSPNRVLDFTPGTDRIELVLNRTSDLAPGALDPSRFAIGTEATTPEQRIVYNPTSGELFFDVNGSLGDMTSALKLFAILQPNLDLSAANFTLVAPGAS